MNSALTKITSQVPAALRYFAPCMRLVQPLDPFREPLGARSCTIVERSPPPCGGYIQSECSTSTCPRKRSTGATPRGSSPAARSARTAGTAAAARPPARRATRGSSAARRSVGARTTSAPARPAPRGAAHAVADAVRGGEALDRTRLALRACPKIWPAHDPTRLGRRTAARPSARCRSVCRAATPAPFVPSIQQRRRVAAPQAASSRPGDDDLFRATITSRACTRTSRSARRARTS